VHGAGDHSCGRYRKWSAPINHGAFPSGSGFEIISRFEGIRPGMRSGVHIAGAIEGGERIPDGNLSGTGVFGSHYRGFRRSVAPWTANFDPVAINSGTDAPSQLRLDNVGHITPDRVRDCKS
jgi:hypothetical protein